MRRELLIMVLLSVLSGSIAAQELPARPLQLSQAVDFLDNAFFTERGSYYSADELRERMQRAYDAGFRRVYFRALAGRAYYPSRVLEMYRGDARPLAAKLVDSIQAYDVLAEYIRAAHALGMELYYWEPVFDTELYLRYKPGTPEWEKYGEFPFRDPALRQEEQWRHRFAGRPAETLQAPVAEIRLRLLNRPEITREQLQIFHGNPGESLRRWEGGFEVAVHPDPEGEGATVVISGLAIAEPCIKLVNPPEAAGFIAVADTGSECTELYYADRERADLVVSSEVFIAPDLDYANNLQGSSGMTAAWGNDIGGVTRTWIIWAGHFDAYAGGLPEYAYANNRERRLEVLRELFERYPELDGVCYSIRSHSTPNGGPREWVGDLAYGFSEPVVEAYRQRHGVDITCEPYDPELLLKLRGEFFTGFLREAAEVIHRHGGKFAVMAPVRDSLRFYDHGAMYPVWRGCNIDNFFDIRTWAQEGLVDTVIILGTRHNMPSWLPEWDREISAFRAALAGTPTRLALHYLINSATPADVRHLLLPAMRHLDLDEIEIYEEHGIFARNLYPVIDECLRRSGREVAPSTGTGSQQTRKPPFGHIGL